MHLKTEEILELLASEPEAERKLLHLLGCAPCRQRAAELAALDDTSEEHRQEPPHSEGAGLAAGGFGLLWARLGEVETRATAEVERDRAGAGALHGELMSLPVDQREQAIQDEPRLHSLGLARLLIAQGEEAAAADPPRAEALARLALAIGEWLGARRFGASAVAEARADAWCLLGDARRRSGKDPELAFRAAARQLAAAPLESRARARLCYGLALLRRDQERTDEALALLARAVELCEQSDDRAGLGVARTAEGWLRLDEGDAEGALISFDLGLDAIGPAGHLAALLDVQHGLAVAAAELGRPAAAERAVAATRELADLLPSERERVLALAREAEVAEASGRDRQSERLRIEAIAQLRTIGAPYDAVLVALELARAYLHEERPDDVERLRAELAPLFTTEEINSHARLAIASAFAARRAGTFARVADFVARSRHNPELVFRPYREAIAMLTWDLLGTDLRREVCRETGVAPEVAERSAAEITVSLQETISSIYHELTGVEILFQETPF